MTENKEGRLVEKERRKVNMVLSARSCGIEEPFTEDLSEKTEYWVQRKPKVREKPREIEQIVKERVENKRQKREEEEASREKMLDQRVKKKNDKFCWF